MVDYGWSPDSRWLVYEKSHPNRIPGIGVYSLEQKKTFSLGDGMTMDFSPAFSADGKYLFFTNRDFNPDLSAFEFAYLYPKATRVYAAALDPSADPPLPARSDEEKGKEASEEADRRTRPPEGRRTARRSAGRRRRARKARQGPRRDRPRRLRRPHDRAPRPAAPASSATSPPRPAPSTTSAATTEDAGALPLRPQGAQGREGPRRRLLLPAHGRRQEAPLAAGPEWGITDARAGLRRAPGSSTSPACA